MPIPQDGIYAAGTAKRPGLWLASGADGAGSFYLLGSVHVGEVRMKGLGLEAETAYRRADEVVLEIDPTQVDLEQTRALARRYGSLEPPATLESVVSPETWALVEELLAATGRSPSSVSWMQPWLLSMEIARGALQGAGLDASQGVEERVSTRATSHDARPGHFELRRRGHGAAPSGG